MHGTSLLVGKKTYIHTTPEILQEQWDLSKNINTQKMLDCVIQYCDPVGLTWIQIITVINDFTQFSVISNCFIISKKEAQHILPVSSVAMLKLSCKFFLQSMVLVSYIVHAGQQFHAKKIDCFPLDHMDAYFTHRVDL